MQKRTVKVALLAVLATILVFGISGVALADQTWRDLPDTVTAKYGITDNQVAGISEGYAGGLWKPFKNVTRAQFTKMAVAAFDIPLAESAIASYTDVPKSNYYYRYVEGAKAAGVVTGTTATTFSPNVNITRQQAIAIVARYIAKAQGYDLATMYTADDINTLLTHFGDAASISKDLREEVAFAFDMGITTGDDFGNIKPLANLTRIQGAALLIRAQGLVPPNLWVPAKLELVSADKTEGLIGREFTVTFAVTTAEGHPAKGVLVDLDALGGAEFYVGNITAQAAVTDSNGLVTVNLQSMEPGTERVTATVAGVGTVLTTRYWLVLDEVYNVKGGTARNNAGVTHTWGVRVVVFGPGPRSTSQNDWYNAIDGDFDPADIDVEDGVDAICDGYVVDDGWTLTYETLLASLGFTPRTMAGIDVEWSIYNKADDATTVLTNEAVNSVGTIVSVDGATISGAKKASGKTDATGYSEISVVSEAVGQTLTYAVAGYAGNPYPQQLFNHTTFQDWQQHNYDWDDQPVANAMQVKTWIAHTMGDGDNSGPVDPAYISANVGEEKTFTIVITDTYGNPVSGRAVEWSMQGVGFFQTDDAGDTSNPSEAAKNIDYDVTSVNGRATLYVKSYDSGEQIIHAKVRDKGTGGSEGPLNTYTAEVQWFDADVVTFDDITTHDVWTKPYTDVPGYWKANNEALSSNPVNTEHTFDLHVYGLKLEYDPTVDDPDGQTPYIDSDAGGDSYDSVIDSKDAEYFGGILLYPGAVEQFSDEEWYFDKLILPWDYPYRYTEFPYWAYDYDGDGIIEAESSEWHWVDGNDDGDYTDTAGGVDYKSYDERGTVEVKVAGQWLLLSFEGAYTEYDYDDDGHKEPFEGVPGIYLPLAGKNVRFSIASSDGAKLTNLGEYFDGLEVDAVAASITPAAPTNVVTDAAGKASVVVTSKLKGPVTIKAVVDWLGNPHNGIALATAFAKKTWTAGTVSSSSDIVIHVSIDGVEVANSASGPLVDSEGNPLAGQSLAYETTDTGDLVLNSAHVEVHVTDLHGNDLPDYEVVYLLESLNSWVGGTQESADTFIPWAYLVDLYDDFDEDELVNYDQNENRPDSDEPVPTSDLYGKIVGDGGTKAFFFNQWLGSEKPVDGGHAGLEDWWNRTPGMAFLGYHADYLAASYNYEWPSDYYGADELFDGFDGVIDGLYTEPYNYPGWPDEHVGLATDGAKAWTLDGFTVIDEEMVPNLLTGSCVDIQLADAFVERYALQGHHLKSIVRVMVYAPADGLVIEEDFLWSMQVHQVWEMPRPTEIVIDPATDYAIAGREQMSLVATVLDQFGAPMPDVDVYFTSDVLEGTIDATFPGTGFLTTDEFGNVSVPWEQDPETWGVEAVTAWVDDGSGDGLTSSASIVQWIFDDSVENLGLDIIDPATTYGPDLIEALAGQQKVTVFSGFTPWNGKTIRVYANPGATLYGTGTYVVTVDLSVSTNTHTWESGQGVFVNANSNNTDEIPNWMYDLVD